MGTLEKILNILKMKNEPKSYSVKFYAEMKLDDGRIIATEDEQFMIGSKVFAVGDDGDAEALSAGNYKMENGNEMTIGDSSEILDLGEEKEAEDVEASEEELSEETEDKTEMSAEVISELMTQVEDLKSKITELSGEPATEGINYNPEGFNFSSTIDLRKLSTKQRAAYYINNK